MPDLELELSADLITALRQLAQRHHGDSDDVAVSRVVEAALEMRLQWLSLAGEAASEVEEPVLTWETEGTSPPDADQEIGSWLFGRRS